MSRSDLWLILDDTYMDKWFILLWYGYELFRWFLGLHSWYLDQICGWFSNGAYMVIFIRIRSSTQFTSSLLDDESLICYCRHMHKDHILQLWCRHIYGWGLLAGYMDEYSKLHCWRHDDDEFLPIWYDISNWWYLVLADLNRYGVAHIECEIW